MKAITLYQPWASLVAAGVKRCETRSWAPSQRQLPVGALLAIHAGQKIIVPDDWDPALRELVDGLAARLPRSLGEVVCVCRYLGASEILWHKPVLSEVELICGDWTPGRWAWEIEVVQRCEPSIAAVGRQGIWDWPGEKHLRGEC